MFVGVIHVFVESFGKCQCLPVTVIIFETFFSFDVIVGVFIIFATATTDGVVTIFPILIVVNGSLVIYFVTDVITISTMSFIVVTATVVDVTSATKVDIIIVVICGMQIVTIFQC